MDTLDFKVNLYPHQMNMILQMEEREKNKTFDIIVTENSNNLVYDNIMNNIATENVGDVISITTKSLVLNAPPGSGKTLAIYGLIKRNKSKPFQSINQHVYTYTSNNCNTLLKLSRTIQKNRI